MTMLGVTIVAGLLAYILVGALVVDINERGNASIPRVFWLSLLLMVWPLVLVIRVGLEITRYRKHT
jgi:hypothetical protein